MGEVDEEGARWQQHRNCKNDVIGDGGKTVVTYYIIL